MKTDAGWLRDERGRVLIPRGANLGGSSKLPAVPNGATWRREGFYDWRNVSFVGRPFPLDKAEEHFARLASWGLRLLRLIVTWEAVEHAGPGEYDRDYLGYLRALVEAAGRHGLELFIDPHQDVWSRWSGGDGAPAWTLTGAGFRLECLHASGAAFLHQECDGPYPRMIWPTNANRLACATMFSLFFGGNEFAPGIRILGEPAQELLQGRYIAAMREVARAVRGLPNVVGCGAMNEPSLGFIGLADLSRLERAEMRKGLMPSPFEAMRAGSGHPTRCARWSVSLLGQHQIGHGLLNSVGTRAWADGMECVWKRAGVWEQKAGRPVLRRPGHFHVAGSLADRYLRPFIARFMTEIRRELPDAILFAEGVPGSEQPGWAAGEIGPVVNAPHWYDGVTLVTKRYQRLFTVDPRSMKLSIGPRAVRRSIVSHLAARRAEGLTDQAGAPTLIGEFGLPFDLNGRVGYRRGNYRAHERALASYYDALDSNLLGATIWNYTADHDEAHGDQWNDEDLSIYSPGAGTDDGSRALRGFCRPYAERIAGVPLSMRFRARVRRFELRFTLDPAITAPTVIYVPRVQYPRGYRVQIRGPETAAFREERDETAQRLLLHLAPALGAPGETSVIVMPRRRRLPGDQCVDPTSPARAGATPPRPSETDQRS